MAGVRFDMCLPVTILKPRGRDHWHCFSDRSSCQPIETVFPPYALLKPLNISLHPHLPIKVPNPNFILTSLRLPKLNNTISSVANRPLHNSLGGFKIGRCPGMGAGTTLLGVVDGDCARQCEGYVVVGFEAGDEGLGGYGHGGVD